MDRRPDRLLRMRDVTDICALSDTTIYDLIKQGKFPKQVAINGMARWSWRQIQRWLSDVKAGQEA